MNTEVEEESLRCNTEVRRVGFLSALMRTKRLLWPEERGFNFSGEP